MSGPTHVHRGDGVRDTNALVFVIFSIFIPGPATLCFELHKSWNAPVNRA